MEAVVHAADVQDRDGGVLLVASLFGMYPFLLKLYADAGYQGPKFQQGMARVCRSVNVEIVRRPDHRCRRLSKDWECLNQNAVAFLHWSSIRLMVRGLCRNTK